MNYTVRNLTFWGLILICPLVSLQRTAAQDSAQITKVSSKNCWVYSGAEDPARLLSEREFRFSPDSWTTPDKFDHLIGSAMLSGSSFLALAVTRNDRRQCFVSSIGWVICLGVLKEVYDLYHPGGHASWKDLTADALGAGLGAFIARSL